MLKRRIHRIGVDELSHRMENAGRCLIVDTRPIDLYDKGHIPGAISIDEQDAEILAKKYDKDTEIITYCSCTLCKESIIAAIQFVEMGFKYVYDYGPGLIEWMRRGYPIEKSNFYN